MDIPGNRTKINKRKGSDGISKKVFEISTSVLTLKF